MEAEVTLSSLQLSGLPPIALASIGHFDVATPGVFIALSAGALIALGLVVGGVVIVSVLVIRAVKKRRPPSGPA